MFIVPSSKMNELNLGGGRAFVGKLVSCSLVEIGKSLTTPC